MFDVKKHLIKIAGGRQYLPVAARLIWFRSEHPDWGIETKAITIDMEKQYAVFESTVYDSAGKLMAKGTKMETVRGFGDWLEKAETGAIGRALAVCGYGTQFAPDLDEVHGGDSGRVDSPYPLSGYKNDRGGYAPRAQSNDRYTNGYYSKSGGANDDARSIRPSVQTETLAIVNHETDSQSGVSSSESPSQSDQNRSDSCESCGTSLKPSQQSLSLRKYGTALCPDCQKNRKSEQAA